MSAKQLAIIDYGMGNLHSVASAIQNVAPNTEVLITCDPKQVAEADHVIFPGVGAIRDCMAEIRARGVDKMVAEAIATSKPLLGICVGMQALMESSEENNGIDCLGLMKGQVKRFPTQQELSDLVSSQGSFEDNFKVPHMGWNQVEQAADHPMWHNIKQQSRFYFLHSYYVDSKSADTENISNERLKQQVAGGCHYAVDFCAAITHGSVFAVQFHPEKSHTDGLQLLKNFVDWNGVI